jgi:hypothetical protein
MEKITDLLLTKVETKGGKSLGRVFEIRCSGEPEHGFTNESREISEFLCGTSGLLEMLGLKKTVLESVSWSAVQKIEDGKIIVDDDYKI